MEYWKAKFNYKFKNKRYGVIYKISFIRDPLCYIGATTGKITKRLCSHTDLKRNRKITEAIHRNGIENTIISELDTAKDKADLIRKEKYYISCYKTQHPLGYNSTPGGEVSAQPDRKKLSDSHKNKTIPKCVKDKETATKQAIYSHPEPDGYYYSEITKNSYKRSDIMRREETKAMLRQKKS